MAAQSTESRELLGPLPAVRPVALDEDGQISIDMAMLPQAGQLVLVWVPYELGGPESIRHSSINTGLRGRFGYHPAVVNGIHIKDNCIELDIFVCRAFSFGTVSESVRYVENLDASIRKYFVPLSPTMPDDLSPTVPSEFGTSPLALGVGFMRDRPSWAMAVMTKLEIGVGQKFRPFPKRARLAPGEIHRLYEYSLVLANETDGMEDIVMTSHSGNARGSSGWGLGRSTEGKGPHTSRNQTYTFSKPHINFQTPQSRGRRRDADPRMVVRVEAADDEEISDQETIESDCTPNDSFTKYIFMALAAQYPQSHFAALLAKEREQATFNRNANVWKWLEEAN